MRYLFLLIFLMGCGSVHTEVVTPSYPIAGKKVYDEIKDIPYQGYEDFWNWMGNIEKLKQKLQLRSE